jgi:hypothetical protein
MHNRNRPIMKEHATRLRPVQEGVESHLRLAGNRSTLEHLAFDDRRPCDPGRFGRTGPLHFKRRADSSVRRPPVQGVSDSALNGAETGIRFDLEWRGAHHKHPSGRAGDSYIGFFTESAFAAAFGAVQNPAVGLALFGTSPL